MAGNTDLKQPHVHFPEVRVPQVPFQISQVASPHLAFQHTGDLDYSPLLPYVGVTCFSWLLQIMMPMRTDCFYCYLSLSSECLDRWQIYLSHVNPAALTTKQVSEFNKNWAPEIPACHNSPHRWNLDLLEAMSSAVTFNIWQLSFWENHCLPVAATCPTLPWYLARPDPPLFFSMCFLTKMKVLASLWQICPDSTCNVWESWTCV